MEPTLKIALATVLLACGCAPDGSCSNVGSPNDPWNVGSISWLENGGVHASLLQYHGYNAFSERQCTDQAVFDLDEAGQRINDPTVRGLLNCHTDPEPALGFCVAPSPAPSLTDATAKYSMPDGSTLVFTASPPTAERTDGGGMVKFSLPLPFDSLPLNLLTTVRGDVTFVVGNQATTQSVAKVDITSGRVIWTVPLIVGGVKQ